ncbi:sensor histidine kinase [Massilia sp. Dwa41.01b]|uniref:sensor histidine kinase n=1 Tax=unclassified Massilia TaxID=2609279 RepID=UPI001603B20A|nr:MULTISPECIES: sensor histidine kinase [unclassified Massilia]QNA87886.1 sensor histidine kinase [Massilia sp. Dwa41.01b]QNA98791.1 sensor histidine kinase [Massilia sp. Se16.2.3]
MNTITQAMRRVWTGPWLPPEQGKRPYLWLLSLGYMFWKYAYVPPSLREALLLSLTLVVFFWLYCASYWARGRQVAACMLVSCLIGAAWVRWNVGAATFFIFACAMAGQIVSVRHAMLSIAGVIAFGGLAALLIEETRMCWLFLMPLLTVSLPVGIGAVLDARLRRSREALLRKQEEVEHMATIAERERISRDLHDLLGHSLSMITLKAELAGKLLDHEGGGDAARVAARREIADIEQAARQTLAEVRAAVSGYRESGLAQALASARASLAAADVELDEQVARVPLAPAAEHVLALALREAVTNVVRHAGARRCTLSLGLEEGNAVLRVADDGTRLRGEHDLRHGNGLAGMQERAASLGGRLALRVGAGLALELRVPAGGAA